VGEALTLHQRALALALDLGRTDLLIAAQAHLGTASQLAGESRKAASLYGQALGSARATGDRHSEAVLLNNIGLLELKAGERANADASFKAALAINQGLNDRFAQAANLANLGLLAEQVEQWSEAQSRFEAALELDKASEHRAAIAADLAGLARVMQQQHRPDAALRYAQRAYWSYRAIGDVPNALTELNRVTVLLREQGRQQEAAQFEAELKSLRDASTESELLHP